MNLSVLFYHFSLLNKAKMASLYKINANILRKNCKLHKILLQKYTTQKTEKKLFIKINYNEQPLFKKILIANRGEIACKIIKTARKMGIKTVAVYSTVDASAKHVKLADESVFIGAPNSKDSYLNMTNILEAITASEAEAIHPGYGFLSENSSFVKALEDRNITFIGPSAKCIAGMGDKLESKRLAQAAGVNTIPGYDGIIMDENECVQIAENIGYPIIIKASAGGGGKGMKIARNNNKAREGFKSAKQEALTSFADDRILIEKFIENPRHIEIQVLGDKHGNIIHLNERECSIQRRNQKIIEEAPSTFLDKDTRSAMGNQAISLCKTLGYYSAGTVEFLIDKYGSFYFLEMNTRLQVEHPITECITGIDIVEQMIRIAKGYPLDIKQEDISINGWAIESRVYAEDPYKNYGLPSTGQLYSYQEPHFAGLRCDSGVEEGSVIGIYYDPMICKLISHGKNRKEAIEKSIKALDSYVIYGVTHNIPLLRDILTEETFTKGNINTNYLADVYPGGFKGRNLNEENRKKLIAIATSIYIQQDLRNRIYLNVPNITIHRKDLEKWDLVISFMDKNILVTASQDNKNLMITIENNVFTVKRFSFSESLLKTDIDGETVISQLLSKKPNGEFRLIYQGTEYKLRILTKTAFDLINLIPKKPKMDILKVVKAPMPGLIKRVSCDVGDEVNEGQELCVVEAMKMQNSMVSEASGKIKFVHVNEDDTVNTDDILIQLE